VSTADNIIEGVAARRTREYSESFKGKRTDTGAYACPVNEAHGAMVLRGEFHTCIVRSEANRVCSAWTAEELNPRVEQFIVGVADEPNQEHQAEPVAPAPATGPDCQCGCGERTRGGKFKPGHDARYHARLKREASPI
jgi:hypothetical protein